MFRKILLLTSIFFLLLEPTVAADRQSKVIGQKAPVDDEEEDFESYNFGNISPIKDPFESYNRKIYAFNDAFDRYFFKHVALAYHNGVPNPVRQSIHNFVVNLYLPISFMNSCLQGKVDNSLATFSRFLINTTIGIGGLFDIAGQKDIRYNHEDFGQTLGYYGVESGPYLMLPILGPSSFRDFGGWLVDKSVGPLDFELVKFHDRDLVDPPGYRMVLAGVMAVDKRERLLDVIDDVRKDSFDPYSTVRSAYMQQRTVSAKN